MAAGNALFLEELIRAAAEGKGGELPETVLAMLQARLSRLERVTILCGRYEGIDDRVRDRLVTEEISIGDYVLSGGELPALMLIDAVSRLLPGSLGCAESAEQESFSTGLLDWPHYTRPESWQGREVPPVLKGGNHAAIERWRRKQSLGRTSARRPDLLRQRNLSSEELALLEEYRAEQDAPRTGHGSNHCEKGET